MMMMFFFVEIGLLPCVISPSCFQGQRIVGVKRPNQSSILCHETKVAIVEMFQCHISIIIIVIIIIIIWFGDIVTVTHFPNVIQTQKCEPSQLDKPTTPFPAGDFPPDSLIPMPKSASMVAV